MTTRSRFSMLAHASLIFLVGMLPGSVNAADALEELTKKYANPTDSKKVVAEKKETAKNHTAPVKKNSPPQVSTKPASTEKSGIFAIQVASYATEAEAHTRAHKLNDTSHSVFTRLADVNGKKWYRVYLGSFTSKEEAEAYHRNLSEDLRKNTILAKIAKEPSSATPEKSVTEKFEPKVVAQIVEPSNSTTKTNVRTPSAETTEEKPAENAAKTDEEPTFTGAFGSWGGVKSKLIKNGVFLNLKYRGEIIDNMSGGLRRMSDYLGQIDLITEFDLEKIAGIKGTSLVIYGLGDHGAHPTEYVGDTFASSNMQAPSTFKVYEAYLRKSVDDRLTLIAGWRDLNADFYFIDSAAGLFNSSFGISPSFSLTGPNGPSIFPATAFALNLKYSSPTSFYFQTSAYNATAGKPGSPYGTHLNYNLDNGHLFIWETGCTNLEGEHGHKFGVGAWLYSQPIAASDTTKPDASNYGFYAIADQHFSKNMAVFAKYGIANPIVSKFKASAEVGFSWISPFASRPNDRFSLGATNAVVSDDFREANLTKSDESVYEANYQFFLSDGISITPDFQYIKNPGLALNVKDAQVGALRLEILF